MIDSMREIFSTKELCEAFEVSPSSYYAWKQPRSTKRLVEEKKIIEAIKAIHSHRYMKSYGSPRMTAELNARGVECGRHRVCRIMREQGIFVRSRRAFRPRTTKVDKTARIAPNHLAKADMPKVPAQQLVSDITYLRTKEGWLYLSIIVDLFSRAIVGWDLSDSLAAQSLGKAIKRAHENGSIQKGCLFHSDRGCQYTSNHVRKTLGRWVRQSMSAKGYCYDNAFAETCFATIKAEMLPDTQLFESKLDARRAVFDYIETFYNRTRRHSSLGHTSPLQFLQLYNQKQNIHLN